MTDDIATRLLNLSRPDASGCRVWVGATDTKGYGRVSVANHNRRAHRVSYEINVGPIPDGLQLDHLCRNRACINPAHLEPVSAFENTHRGVGLSAANALKTSCKRGHPLSGDNLKVSAHPNCASGYMRRCRTCTNLHSRRRKAAAREAKRVAS